MNKFIICLLLVSLLKEIIFSAIIPMWHTPDEQAHFAQVAYFAEFGKMPKYPPDLNREIWESEKLLGTDRDKNGNNKFTFHPEYRIEYTNSLVGKYEQQIINLPVSYRTELIRQESANYPPLYYWLGGFTYRLFYGADLITRVFMTRFFSILCGVLIVCFSWLIAKELFPNKPLFQMTLPLLVSFQPMFSFVSAGVTSDNLINLLFTVLLYLSVLIITKQISKKLLGIIIFTLGLTYLTKPQFVLYLPILFFTIILSVLIDSRMNRYLKIKLGGLLVALLAGVSIIIINSWTYKVIEQIFYSQSFFPGDQKIMDLSFWQFLRQTIQHTVSEVIPWYWGVFNWLGVVLPRDVNRIINRIMVIATIGLVIKIIYLLKKRSKADYGIIIMLVAAFIYFSGITFYNYLFTLSHGYPFGIQGRYYFPTIVSQMLILMIGLEALVPLKFSLLKIWIIKLLGLSMIVLNFIALWVIGQSYYDFANFNLLVNQISQYKPLFYKGLWFYFWLFAYFSSLLLLIWNYLRLNRVTRTNDI